MNELKKADEIARAMRSYASDCDADEACFQCTFAWVCDKFDNNAPKIIADLIDSLTAQLAASQRREKAAVEDIARLVASTPEIKCSLVCDGECLDCTGSATGTPRGYHYRGPQTEKGAADGN